MQITFRPKVLLWLRRNPTVLIFALLVIPLLILDRFSILALGFTFTAFIIVLLGIRKAISNFVAIDSRQISGSFYGQTFKILWWDVRAIWLDSPEGENPVLMLGTESNIYAIPLRYLDANRIWNLVQSRVNPAALRPEARQNLPYWQPVGKMQIPELEEPIVLHGRLLEKVIGWCSMGFFVGILWAGYPHLSIGPELVLAGFILFSCSYLLSAYYSLRISPTGITHQMLFGEFYIAWDELKSVNIAQNGTTVLFQGESKKILVYGPRTWQKSTREDMMQYIGMQLEMRQIHVKVDPWLGMRIAFSNRAARIKGSPRG